MRLTPVCVCFSSTDGDGFRSDDERDVDANRRARADVTASENADEKGVVGAASNSPFERRLRTILDELHAPVTVDELADHLVDYHEEADSSSIETWGDVHERLYEHTLPGLEAAGIIEFDLSRGVVYPSDRSDGDAGYGFGVTTVRAALVVALIGLVLVAFVLAPPPVVVVSGVALVGLGLLTTVAIR